MSEACPELGRGDPLDPVAGAAAEIDAASDEAALEQLRVKYLGRNGLFKALMERLRALPPAEKGPFGKRVNDAKRDVEARIEARRRALQAEPEKRQGFFDWTLPGVRPPRGSLHPLTAVTEELLEVFGKLGFRTATGPEVERPFYNFEALNIPPDHPARDPAENFFLVETARTEAGGEEPLLLRSQTSTIQIHAMQRAVSEGGLPLRVVGPGKVFRPDEVDATHHFQFSQIEGLAIDEHLSFADLKTVLVLFARTMFGPEQEVRLRPSFFPFTEPSAEFDFRCWVCRGKGCPTCKRTGWVELGGCGMVDPHVFDAVGIDNERWTGFAFGFGIDRLAMLRFGIRDIRLLTENDVRFLAQFE
jgi:phenylalanyl-tRNA synthetase alpha chain